MIALLSPAKTIDMECEIPPIRTTKIRFAQETNELHQILIDKTPNQLVKLMSISPKLAELNFQRFQEYQWPHKRGKSHPAIFAFRGDVYQGLDADTLAREDLDYAQSHLRLLSGFYGLLRPLDKIMAYRLEMGTKLKNPAGNNLYQWWGDSITHLINKDLAKHQNKTVINLASEEYSKAVKAQDLRGEYLQVDFKEENSGQYKIISFFAKKARGAMARWICEKKPINPVDLKDFSEMGYRFHTTLSTERHFVFTRSSS